MGPGQNERIAKGMTGDLTRYVRPLGLRYRHQEEQWATSVDAGQRLKDQAIMPPEGGAEGRIYRFLRGA
jgi:hypothetical protein